jgi:hypothetical protein
MRMVQELKYVYEIVAQTREMEILQMMETQNKNISLLIAILIISII